MTFLPVVGRELCAESRRPFNYWLRVLGAGALTVVAVLTLMPHSSMRGFVNLGNGIMWNGQNGMVISAGQNPYGLLGATLFGYLNATIFAAMWLLVPLLTADSINREKREGTLGLLFLTPLTSSGIVIGKSLVHALRALTLYFTMIPVLLMPLMLGGVTMKDGLMAALINLGALLLALAAGLLASAWTRDWLKSVAVAQCLSLLFAAMFMAAQRSSLERVLIRAAPVTAVGGNNSGWAARGVSSPLSQYEDRNGGVLSSLRSLFDLNTNLAGNQRQYIYTPAGPVYVPLNTAWSDVWTTYSPSVHAVWFRQTGLLLVGCLVVLILAVVAAGKSVEHSWRETPPSPKRQRVNDVFTQPVVSRGFMRQKHRRALERNPMGWLQQYSWSARLTKWGWCGFIVLGELLLAASWRDAWDAQFWMALLVLLGLSFSAAGSFHRERETGALELLLVTPLRAGQIIRGRLGGIRMQYLPSLATLLLAWACLVQPSWVRSVLQPDQWEGSQTRFVWLLAALVVSFCTVPIIGLYFSLRPMNQIVSWLCTCVVGLLIPWLLFLNINFILQLLLYLGISIGFLLPLKNSDMAALVVAFSWQLAAALGAGLLLYRSLSRRHFITCATLNA